MYVGDLCQFMKFQRKLDKGKSYSLNEKIYSTIYETCQSTGIHVYISMVTYSAVQQEVLFRAMFEREELHSGEVRN